MRFCFPLLLIFSAACAAVPGGAAAVLDAPRDAVLAAVNEALAEFPRDSDPGAGLVRTSWIEREAAGSGTLLLGRRDRERIRYEVRVRGVEDGRCEVTVRTDVERRAATGSRSLTWERVSTDGRAEQELLQKILGRP